jgi:hypothetical protein
VCSGFNRMEEQSPSSGQVGIIIRIAADMRHGKGGNKALCRLPRERNCLNWRLGKLYCSLNESVLYASLHAKHFCRNNTE